MECGCGCGGNTKVIPKTDTLRGRVKGQFFRFIHGHSEDSKKPLKYNKVYKRWFVRGRYSTDLVPWARIIYQNYVLKGKELPLNSVVHHKDGDTTNDDPNNLKLYATNGEHISRTLRRSPVLLLKDGLFEIFESMTDASEFLQCPFSTVNSAWRNKCRVRGWNVYRLDR